MKKTHDKGTKKIVKEEKIACEYIAATDGSPEKIRRGDQTFEKNKSLGQGSHSEVYLFVNRKDNTSIAVKMPIINSEKKLAHPTFPYPEQYEREASLLNKFEQHDHASAFQLPSGMPCLIMDYLQGVVFDKCFGYEKGRSTEGILALIRKAAIALLDVHNQDIVQGDVKLGNFMMLLPQEIIKSFDFGFGSICGEPAICTDHDAYYWDPQRCNSPEPVPVAKFGQDVFSFAVMVLDLLKYFSEESHQKDRTSKKQIHPKESDIFETIKKYMENIKKEEVENRPDVEDIVEFFDKQLAALGVFTSSHASTTESSSSVASAGTEAKTETALNTGTQTTDATRRFTLFETEEGIEKTQKKQDTGVTSQILITWV